MKKMIQEKKVTLPIATNYMASNFINLEKKDIGYTKLLGILEKKLNQKTISQDFNNILNNFKSNFIKDIIFCYIYNKFKN